MFKKLHPSAKATRELLRRIRPDSVELELARAEVFEEVRTWKDLNPALRDRLMLKVAQQSTKGGLLKIIEEWEKTQRVS